VFRRLPIQRPEIEPLAAPGAKRLANEHSSNPLATMRREYADE
jgi:hypothetical protein